MTGVVLGPWDPEGARRGSRDPRKEQGAGGAGAGAPLVSVVIPCYNQAHFLGEAIDSVLAQEVGHPRLEVVVVDDGSTDDISEVAGRYPGVRLVRQENRGLSGARNAGLGRARGEYVVFLDADDRLLPGALEAGVERLGDRPGCAFVFGRCRFIAADGSPLPTPYRPPIEGDRYAALLQRNHIWMPAMVMYRRAVFESVGGFDTSLRACEDYDLYLRIARRFPVHLHDEVVAQYRQHGTNMTRNPALMLSTSVSVLRKQRKHVKGNKQYKEAYKDGFGYWQGGYGHRLIDEVRAHVKERKWKQALRGLPVLLRYYPRGLALLLLDERRMERRRLARRLLLRKRELKAYERRLEESEGAREPEGALAEERQEAQQLRRRIRGLERRIQDLDQRALSKRLGRVRAKVLRK